MSPSTATPARTTPPWVRDAMMVVIGIAIGTVVTILVLASFPSPRHLSLNQQPSSGPVTASALP